MFQKVYACASDEKVTVSLICKMKSKYACTYTAIVTLDLAKVDALDGNGKLMRFDLRARLDVMNLVFAG